MIRPMHDGSHGADCAATTEVTGTERHRSAFTATDSPPVHRKDGYGKFFSRDAFSFSFAVPQDHTILARGSGEVHCTAVLSGSNFSPGQNAFAESSPALRFRRGDRRGGSVQRKAERKRMEIEAQAIDANVARMEEVQVPLNISMVVELFCRKTRGSHE